MGDLSLEKAYGALKRGGAGAVYYLTGSEEILKDELVAAIAEAVLDPSARDFNLDVRAAADLDGEALHALVETPPMLAERRVVVVRGIDHWRRNAKVWDVLYRYVEHPSPATVLVLTQSGDANPDPRIARRAAHVAVTSLRPDQAARWVAHRAARAGVTLDPDAAAHLMTAVSGDLGHVAVELDKLAAAAVGDAPVTVSDVARLVGVERGETTQDWVAAVLARDGGRALELLDIVLRQSGVGGVQLVGALGTALVGVRLARALVDAGTPWPRVEGAVFAELRGARVGRLNWRAEAAAWTRAARQWSADDLATALAAAGAADRRLKSTTITDERGILMSMLLAFPLARAAA
jgi:DNA polymerase III delta subunit